MNGFYNASTESKFNKVVAELLSNGYEWVGLNKKPTFEECKKFIHGNAKLVVHAFCNDITGKKEIQFGTKSIYKTYPQHKNIKVVEMLEVI